jgi:broad specificity phosphatase PhoE
MRIYLVRHGEKEHDGADAALTEHHEKQIQLLARRLRHTDKLQVWRVYSTAHPRSMETAAILSKAIMAPVVQYDRFVELEHEVFESDIVTPEAYENILQIHGFVDEILANNQDVLLAMHGTINNIVISHLLGIPFSVMKHFSMDYASITCLEQRETFGELRWKLRTYNDTHHLRVP